MSVRKFHTGDKVIVLYPDYLAGLRGEVVGTRRPRRVGNLLYGVRIHYNGGDQIDYFRAGHLDHLRVSSSGPVYVTEKPVEKHVEQPKVQSRSWIGEASTHAMKSII